MLTLMYSKASSITDGGVGLIHISEILVLSKT